MRSPETASPSLTIRRSITCECDQHLHFSAEVSQNRSRKTLHSARRGPGAKAFRRRRVPPRLRGRDCWCHHVRGGRGVGCLADAMLLSSDWTRSLMRGISDSLTRNSLDRDSSAGAMRARAPLAPARTPIPSRASVPYWAGWCRVVPTGSCFARGGAGPGG